ncbi:transglutaminase-like domain-containing protein [Acetivibrio mesophilus]|uniref:Transglutaminase domain-containing protein n=1 Tax=Acetivibrio mesophilus TaxID=2487273 RepID=A0A4V1K1T5_9FIRM|nr:transglutaminase-like domain-containing protein [Acetivibrio mesophilus]ODM27877.1 transglutaminase [Clostridium sp. Bc-iso-3]RXE57909.1 transglutaminase domain-containing protein [Acetivibrio mesophilus]HHV28734.1 transglutaminase domain-containing protein [Clostridium sp.]
MRKLLCSVVMLVLTITLCTNAGFAVTTSITEKIVANGVTLQSIPSNVEGKVTVTGETVNSLIKILIVKDETQRWYDVELIDGKFSEEIWLIDGMGAYQISVLVHKEDRIYTFGPTVFVENTVEVNRFTVPTLHVESNDENIIALAQELTKDAKTDREKAEKIYYWVVNNIKYDYDKYIRQINKNYDNPYGAINTLETKKGVCYDYSALVAALGRASGLQVKMIKGNFIGVYSNELHAWNEIYISEEDRWINVDSTFGSTLKTRYFDNSNFYKDHEKLEEY